RADDRAAQPAGRLLRAAGRHRERRAALAARSRGAERRRRQHRGVAGRRAAAVRRVAAGGHGRRVGRPQRRLPPPSRERRARARRAAGALAMIDPAVSALLRGALALVLAGAAAHKLRDLHAFRVALGDYQLVPWALTGLVAPALVAAEIATAALLVSPLARPAGFKIGRAHV